MVLQIFMYFLIESFQKCFTIFRFSSRRSDFGGIKKIKINLGRPFLEIVKNPPVSIYSALRKKKDIKKSISW